MTLKSSTSVRIVNVFIAFWSACSGQSNWFLIIQRNENILFSVHIKQMKMWASVMHFETCVTKFSSVFLLVFFTFNKQFFFRYILVLLMRMCWVAENHFNCFRVISTSSESEMIRENHMERSEKRKSCANQTQKIPKIWEKLVHSRVIKSKNDSSNINIEQCLSISTCHLFRCTNTHTISSLKR